MGVLIGHGFGNRLFIYIKSASTGAPATGLGGGQAYFLSSNTLGSGTADAAMNTLVECDSTHAKGWYEQPLFGETLRNGPCVLLYHTPTTAANVGQAEFTVDPPAVLYGSQYINMGGQLGPALTLIGDIANGYPAIDLIGGIGSIGSVMGIVVDPVTPTTTSIDANIGIDRATGFFNRAWLGVTTGPGLGQWRRVTTHTRISDTVGRFAFSGVGTEADAAFAITPVENSTITIEGRG